MSKGYVPYVQFADLTTVVHTCSDDEKEIKVYIETPDDEHFFKTLELYLHDLTILKHIGYTDEEVRYWKMFCLRNYELIVECAKEGGMFGAENSNAG